MAAAAPSLVSPSRSYLGFLESLDARLAARASAGKHCGLLIVEVHNLQQINSSAGYRQGYRLCQQFGGQLKKLLRPNDWLWLLAPDRFALVLEQVQGSGHLLLAANRVAHLAGELGIPEKPHLAADIRTGAAVFPEHGADAETLLRHAEWGLATAVLRQLTFAVYEPDAGGLADDWELEKELELGLENGEYELHYQPKIEAQSLAACGAEALMRWHNPRRGAVSPERFIKIAEKTGQIDALLNFALHTSARAMSGWSQGLSDFSIAVNVSPYVLERGNVAAAFRHVTALWGVPQKRYVVEVTESGLVQAGGRALESLAELREAGMRVSIDDFGTGNSSLAYLKDVPADEVKIDRQFISSMLVNEANLRLVKTIIDLAHGLGLSVVAEGVESGDCVRHLQEFGCDVLQGFHFSKPLRDTDFVSWCREFGRPK